MWTRNLNREPEPTREPFAGKTRKRSERRKRVRRFTPGMSVVFGGSWRSGVWCPWDLNEHDPNGQIKRGGKKIVLGSMWSGHGRRKRQSIYRRLRARCRTAEAIDRRLGIPSPQFYDV